MRLKFVPVAAAALISMAALTGCGGDDEASAYCDTVKKMEKQDSADFDPEEMATELAADAPDEIKDDWETLKKALAAQADAESSADAAEQDPEEALAKADELRALAEDTQKAGKEIAQYTEDECDVVVPGIG